MVDFADRMGFEKRWLPEELGLALGQGEVTPLEMASFAGAVVNAVARPATRPPRNGRARASGNAPRSHLPTRPPARPTHT